MEIYDFFRVVRALCFSGLWIVLGILCREHFHTLLTYIFRKPLDEESIDRVKNEKFLDIVKIAGILFIAIGVTNGLFAITSWIGTMM